MPIRESGLIRKILRSGLFKVVLMTLKNERAFAKNPQKKGGAPDDNKPWMKVQKGGNQDDEANQLFHDFDKPKANRQQTIGSKENERNIELTLSMLVLLANVSSGKDFIAEILAMKSFNPEDNLEDIMDTNGSISKEESLYWDENDQTK